MSLIKTTIIFCLLSVSHGVSFTLPLVAADPFVELITRCFYVSPPARGELWDPLWLDSSVLMPTTEPISVVRRKGRSDRSFWVTWSCPSSLKLVHSHPKTRNFWETGILGKNQPISSTHATGENFLLPSFPRRVEITSKTDMASGFLFINWTGTVKQ